MTMRIELIYVLKIIAIAIGLIFIYLGLFLYEDEQGKIQNTLEESWIKIDRHQHSALAKHLTFMGVVTRIMSVALNRVFGEKLLSIKSIGVSACYSNASVYICSRLLAWYQSDYSMLFRPTWMYISWIILKILVFIALGLVPIFITKSIWLKIWFGAVIFGIFCWELIEAIMRYDITQIDDVFMAAQMSVNTGIVIGIAFDVFFIAAIRKVLRWKLGELNYPKLTAIFVFNIIMALALFFIPVLYFIPNPSTSIIAAYYNDLLSLSLLGLFRGIVLSNLFIALFAIIVVLLTITVLAHQIFWPLLARPVYSLQKLGVAKRSKFLSTTGVILIIFGVGGATWLEKIVEKLNPF